MQPMIPEAVHTCVHADQNTVKKKRPKTCDGEMRKNLYLCIISPMRLLQKKRATFIFRNSDHSKATFAFDELLTRRHLL